MGVKPYYKKMSKVVSWINGTPFINGDEIGFLDKSTGYIRLSCTIDKKSKSLYAHRLRWFMAHNELPYMVDHINRNRTDNRLVNLRSVTSSQSGMNMTKKSKVSSSKYKGVCWDKSRNKWICHIKINGKSRFLGRFKSEKEAALKYNFHAKLLFGEYAAINEGVK